MAKLSWVTDTQKTIANLLIGIPAEVQLIVSDAANSGETITFTKVLGDLPPGMTLTSSGTISGTPEYSTPSNNYFTTQEYTVHIKAQGTTGLPITDYFKITISNTVNADFSWATPAGRIGTAPANEYYSIRLLAESSSSLPITYSFVSGELPAGMQLSTAGYLQGVPTFVNAIATNTSQIYKFTVRATNSLSHVIDRSFSLVVTNVVGPAIQPEAKDSYFLGTYFDGSFFSQQLTVTEASAATKITWTVVDGDKNPLPDGLNIDQNGLLSGIIQPLQLAGQYGPSGYSGNEFTGQTVTAGSFIPRFAYIIHYVGSTDFTACGAAENKVGVEFVATNAGTGTGTAYPSSTAIITNSQEYSYGPYDFNRLNQSKAYSFTVQAYDGANYDLQQYTINVVARTSFTADSTNDVNDTYLTVDAINQNIPIITTASSVLPIGRQDTYYAFKFSAVDFQNDPFTFKLVNTADTFDSGPFDPLERNDFYNGLPGSFDSYDPNAIGSNPLPGLQLDENTGWVYGKIDPQTESIKTFTFGVVVTKTVGTDVLTSTPRYFTLDVLGDVNNIIEWTSPSNLGTIDNGSVSELSIKAVSVVGKPLIYSLVDQPNVSVHLPQGLTLLPSGDISGRASFELFTIDKNTTTFDKTTTTIDRTFSFTAKVATTDGTASSTKQFTLALNIIDIEPYENLYLRAMPAHDQRQIYNSIITNAEIFDPAVIYRPTDPWFGVRKNIETLFIPGLNAETLDAYQTAIEQNHWTKTYNFNDVKTAAVFDEYYNTKYEVVYIEITDPAENINNVGAGLELDLTKVIANPYIDADGNEYTVAYPNSTENMIKRLEAGVGYYDQSSLPPWMTSNQPDSSKSKFKPPLGYVKAVVLAYTVPGASKLIAYRLKAAGIRFNNVEFTVDRYRVDDFYTQNFNTTTREYVKSTETTFDTLPSKNFGIRPTIVTYAVSTSFSEINQQSVDYVSQNGRIDGVSDFANGQTLIFAQQEGFGIVAPYDGWINYNNAYPGDTSYTVVPGYLEKFLGISTTNQRGGIWQINIVNNTVYLVPIAEVENNQRIQVINGRSFSGAVLFYDPIIKPGKAVPAYSTFDISRLVTSNPTTFNNGTTRFISNRDRYYAPGTQDKYLSFPQHGVFK